MSNLICIHLIVSQDVNGFFTDPAFFVILVNDFLDFGQPHLLVSHVRVNLTFGFQLNEKFLYAVPTNDALQVARVCNKQRFWEFGALSEERGNDLIDELVLNVASFFI